MPLRWEDVPPYLVCPVCRSTLAPLSVALRCERGHSFDVAREGYVNLLATPKRLSPTVGDSRAMLRARQSFLARGHYTRLADAVATAACDWAAERDIASRGLRVVDLGCGTGYYLGRLCNAFGQSPDTRTLWPCGLDVSRDAVSLAAREHPDAYFVVADVTRVLPLADAGVDVALNIFAPRNPTEYARVLRPDGLLLVVIPAERHLASLRERLPLLQIEANKSEHVRAQLAGAFRLERQVALTEELNLSGSDVTSLVEMTPAYRHLTEPDRARLASAGPLRTEASFEALHFRRSH